MYLFVGWGLGIIDDCQLYTISDSWTATSVVQWFEKKESNSKTYPSVNSIRYGVQQL